MTCDLTTCVVCGATFETPLDTLSHELETHRYALAVLGIGGDAPPW